MKKQKQKKILVVAAIALMIALVSGMGAMTYARYISSANVPTQQATAAQWGFVVTADASQLFGANYTETDTDKLATFVETNGVAVKASTSADVVAPGTTGSMTIAVNGKAEVRAKVTFKFAETGDPAVDDVSDILLPGATTAEDYHPIEWTLKKDGVVVTGAENVTLAELIAVLENESATIEAGAPLTASYTISWKWDFNDDSDELSLKDTLIGLKSAGFEYNANADKNDLTDVLAHDNKTYQEHISDTAYGNIVTLLKFTLNVTVEQIQ